jgi:hypothetical protein
LVEALGATVQTHMGPGTKKTHCDVSVVTFFRLCAAFSAFFSFFFLPFLVFFTLMLQKALGFDSVAATMGSSAVTAIQRGQGEEELDLGLSKEKEKQMQAFVDGLETWDLNPADIQLGKELGRGAYGTVFSATLRGQNVAVKKLNSQNIDEKKLTDFKKEVEIMSKLRHPNVLLFMGACTQPGNLMIVTELMPKGSLRELLKDSKYTFKQRMQFAKQTAQGMAWLHTMTPPMIHRDLVRVFFAFFLLFLLIRTHAENGEFAGQPVQSCQGLFIFLVGLFCFYGLSCEGFRFRFVSDHESGGRNEICWYAAVDGAGGVGQAKVRRKVRCVQFRSCAVGAAHYGEPVQRCQDGGRAERARRHQGRATHHSRLLATNTHKTD